MEKREWKVQRARMVDGQQIWRDLEGRFENEKEAYEAHVWDPTKDDMYKIVEVA